MTETYQNRRMRERTYRDEFLATQSELYNAKPQIIPV